MTGITSGDQTLLAPLLFFIFFLSWHFYFQKEFDPSCYSRQNVSLGFSAGEKQKKLCEVSGELPPKVFSAEISCRKTTRTHFDGNNNWDQTLFENKNAMREKKNHLLPKRKKSLIPGYSRQNVSLCFFCRISAKTPSGQQP